MAAFLVSTNVPAQIVRIAPERNAKPPISLEPAPGRMETGESPVRGEASFASAPANFRSFRPVASGESGDAEALTLHFSATTKLTRIESTRDFKVEQGSSCVEGNVYNAGGSCRLLVRFAPQGPGRRLGKIAIVHTASATPFYVGLGGNGYAPVVSFTPAIITTVPGTYPSSRGLLSGASNLTVDGGDTLYVADTGNNVIRYLDSGGAFTTISGSGLSAPLGVAVDNFGDVYFDEPTAGLMYEIFNYGSQLQVSGTGTDSCTLAAPCKMPNEKLYNPGQMAIDYSNQLFFAEQDQGAAVSTVLPYSPTFARIYDPFTYQEGAPDAFAVDQYDNLYSYWNTTGVCAIDSQTYSDSANGRALYKKVAGGRVCGFSGDGGQARNAEIGNVIGQMYFDIAGNLYFTDQANQRVRRVDAATGIINTIAGNGAAGYGGDNGMATAAALNAPTGVAVDSQGQVYIISGTGSGNAQVVRKLGTKGVLSFGSLATGTASAANLVTVSNTGNSSLTWTNVVITGANPGDFTIDPTTTSCNLATQGGLASGSSCVVGVIFKPAAAGSRSANLVFLDNTVTNSNTVLLSGTGASGAKTTPTVAITSPAAGSSVTAGTVVTFAVKVSSATGPVPTGTVKFALDGTLLNGSAALTNGTATISFSTSVVGSHLLGTAYNGDSNYNATGSVSETITVTAAPAKAPAVVKVSSASATVSACKPVTFSIAVTAGTTAKPTGTVLLKDGSTVLGSVVLSGGAASFSVPKLAVGAHAISATYSGDATHAPGASAVFTETANPNAGCAVQPVLPVTFRLRSLVE